MMQSLDRVWNFSKRLFTRTSKDARSVILTLVKCGLRDPKLVTGGKVRRSNGKPGRSRKPTSRCAIRWSGWRRSSSRRCRRRVSPLKSGSPSSRSSTSFTATRMGICSPTSSASHCRARTSATCGGRELSGYNLLGSVSLSVQSDVRDMP